MRSFLVRAVYFVAKGLGLFYVARHLTRDGLRILCYHGFSLQNEEEFRSGLFMRPADFARRLRFLARHKFPVLPLDEAVQLSREGRLPFCATVITIDDGFYGVYRHAFPILRERQFPATLYMTTYYFQKGTPIFHICVAYILWKTTKKSADLSGLGVPELSQAKHVPLGTPVEREGVDDIVVEYGEAHCDEPTRGAILARFGAELGVDHADIVDSRILSLVNAEELREMAADGIDVQLHTHRHQFPADPGPAHEELAANRAALQPLTSLPLRHFCYPSGEWSRAHWDVLRQAEVATATTCEPGLVYGDTPRLALPRILDSHRVSQIEFEAEMVGFSELIRKLRRGLGRGRAARGP